MKLTTTRSPKFRRLMNLTGLSRPAAAGTLELLWLFTMEQAPSGDVGRWEDMDLEAELDWTGEPGALIEALVDAGWLDRCATHRLVIHDWADHLPEFLQKRVDRKTLRLAVATPIPDGGRQRPTPSANGGIREGKGSLGKGREGKVGEAPAPRAPRARPSNPKTRCPDQLEPEQRDAIRAWATEQGFDLTILRSEWEAHRDHWRAESKLRADWPASFRSWLRKAAAFKARDQAAIAPRESAAQARERRLKEAALEAFRRGEAADGRSDSPPLIALAGGLS